MQEPHDGLKMHSTVTVGTKGQIVIPVEVRTLLNILSWDILMVVTKYEKAIGIIKMDDIDEMLEYMQREIQDSTGDKDMEEVYRWVKMHSTVTVGTKGQIVIPMEVRTLLNTKVWDTLMVFTKYEKAIGIIKMDQLDEMMEYMKRESQNCKDGKKSNA